MAFFVALYSYKGGVGRTLALANLGYSLASRGKRVVLVDMDLEAPALHDFPEFALRGKKEKKGIVEHAASFASRGKCPAIKSYVYACRKSPGSGKLWLMPAGRFGDNYQQTLSRLNWRRLHPRKGTGPFIEGFRKALAEAYQPHYVLIDARTGLSDVGGISTHHLADMVVVVFNLTRGCIEGSVRAYRSFTSEGSRVRAVQLVAGPVPQLATGGDSLVEKRLKQAGDLMPLGTSFGREIIRIDYDPSMVLAEDLAVRKPEIFRAAACYEKLREAVQRANPTEVFPVVEEAHKRRSEGRLREGLRLLKGFVERNPDNAEGYLELGNLLLEADRAKDAVRYFQEAVKHQPDAHKALYNWGNALRNLADLEKGDQRQKLLQQACGRYEEAVRHKPDNHEALHDWSYALLLRTYGADGKTRHGLLEEAARRAAAASAIEAHMADYNLACVRSLQGRFIEASELVADELVRRPDLRSHVLEDADLESLWKEVPALHAAIQQSLDAGSDLEPIKQWKAKQQETTKAPSFPAAPVGRSAPPRHR